MAKSTDLKELKQRLAERGPVVTVMKLAQELPASPWTARDLARLQEVKKDWETIPLP